jgi:hypothetical protein
MSTLSPLVVWVEAMENEVMRYVWVLAQVDWSTVGLQVGAAGLVVAIALVARRGLSRVLPARLPSHSSRPF